MSDSRTLLLSIRPKHAALIFSGEKAFELRRVRPKIVPGDRVLIYVTAPEMSLLGGFEVSELLEDSATRLWRSVGTRSGLLRTDFMRYFEGCESAFAIGVRKKWRLPRGIGLNQLRKRVPGFLPPQSYWYLSERMSETLLKMAWTESGMPRQRTGATT